MRLVNSSLTRLNCPVWRLGPVVNLGLVLEAGARHGLAELGVLVERDALDGLEPRVVGVLGAVDEPRLRRCRLRLGGLLRRRRVLGRLGGAAERALDVLEEAHGRFLLVLSSDRSVAARWPRYIDACDMSVPMRLATCWYCCIRCVQPIEMPPHRPGGTPFEVTY